MPIFETTNISYTKTAERILAGGSGFLTHNPDMVHQFVNALFQAVEISLKDLGKISALPSGNEMRDRRLVGNGHDIEKIVNLLKDKLGGVYNRRLVRILTDGLPSMCIDFSSVPDRYRVGKGSCQTSLEWLFQLSPLSHHQTVL